MCHQGYHKGLESENSATNFLEGLFTMRGKLPGSNKIHSVHVDRK